MPDNKCLKCKFFEPDGIHLSATGECMLLKEHAEEAVKYCDGPYVNSSPLPPVGRKLQ